MNQCGCNFGVATEGIFCPRHGNHYCESCLDHYMLKKDNSAQLKKWRKKVESMKKTLSEGKEVSIGVLFNERFSTVENSCVKKTCLCENGTGNTDTCLIDQTYVPEFEKILGYKYQECETCDSHYLLTNQFDTTQPHNLLNLKDALSQHFTETGQYILNVANSTSSAQFLDSKINQIETSQTCRIKTCICDHGTPKTGQSCPDPQITDCQSCDFNYHAVDYLIANQTYTRCQQNACTCPMFGYSAVPNYACKIHNQPVCDCPYYYFANRTSGVCKSQTALDMIVPPTEFEELETDMPVFTSGAGSKTKTINFHKCLRYYNSQVWLEYNQADNLCKNQGMNLPLITSLLEYQFWNSTFLQLPSIMYNSVLSSDKISKIWLGVIRHIPNQNMPTATTNLDPPFWQDYQSYTHQNLTKFYQNFDRFKYDAVTPFDVEATLHNIEGVDLWGYGTPSFEKTEFLPPAALSYFQKNHELVLTQNSKNKNCVFFDIQQLAIQVTNCNQPKSVICESRFCQHNEVIKKYPLTNAKFQDDSYKIYSLVSSHSNILRSQKLENNNNNNVVIYHLTPLKAIDGDKTTLFKFEGSAVSNEYVTQFTVDLKEAVLYNQAYKISKILFYFCLDGQIPTDYSDLKIYVQNFLDPQYSSSSNYVGEECTTSESLEQNNLLNLQQNNKPVIFVCPKSTRGTSILIDNSANFLFNNLVINELEVYRNYVETFP